MSRLRHSDPASDGIRRRRRGKGFSYSRPDGTALSDPDVLERLKALAVPPAWTDVWICPWDNGHIQATGLDNAGRRQYLYHEEWRRRRDREKYRRVRDFGLALPHLREVVTADLRRSGLGKHRVLAAGVRLLDVGFFRVGSEQYAEENETYGVTTLLKNHVQRRGDSLVFDYEAKGSKRRVATVDDPLLLPIISRLKARRSGGDALLAWRGPHGWTDARAADINAYIKKSAGEQFSAKDFRTWSATVVAAICFAQQVDDGSPSRAKVNAVIRQVADAIGDTPAVCRSAYIDPAVIDRYREGRTLEASTERIAADANDGDWLSRVDPRTRGRVERSLIRLLKGDSE